MFIVCSRSVSIELCNIIEVYIVTNAVEVWVVPVLALILSLATFIQLHYSNKVPPRLVQDGRELVTANVLEAERLRGMVLSLLAQ